MSYNAYSRADLRAGGWSRRAIDGAVARGELIRARQNRYLGGDVPDPVVQAVRIGGRLTCLSLLVLHGVFVLRRPQVHVHLPRCASRLRSASDRVTPLASRRRRLQRLHWLALVEPVGEHDTCVAIVDALIHSVLCQPSRAAVATLDSALHLGLVSRRALTDAFGALPAKYRVLLALLDARAESGPESIARLMLRGLGCRVEVQVTIAGVGRVDLVVDGWLVVECDSEAHHSGWEKQRADRARDLALAARGYTTIRPTADDILWHPQMVLDAVRGLRAAHATR